MVLQSDYPPDIRLTKEIGTLVESNYKVFLLCNNAKGLTRIEEHGDFNIFRLRKYSFFPQPVRKLFRLPLIFNPVWIYNIVYLIIKCKIKILHVHDLPLAPLVVFLGKLFRIPVVYDMHENYPATLKEWSKGRNLFQRLIKNHYLARILNKVSLKYSSKIIVVVEEQKENLLQQGVKSEKIYVVSNTVQVEKFTSIKRDALIENKYKNNFVIIYIGSFSIERGLQTAIDSISIIVKDIPNVKLVFVGDGNNRVDLEKRVKNNKMSEFVEFNGWVDFNLVPSYIKASQICIIPQPSNMANDTTIPHKMFQYMIMEKPLLVSNAKPLKRIVTETGCGEVFNSGSAEDFADKVLKIYHSAIKYGENGKKAVLQKYNWESNSKNLLNLYSTL